MVFRSKLPSLNNILSFRKCAYIPRCVFVELRNSDDDVCVNLGFGHVNTQTHFRINNICKRLLNKQTVCVGIYLCPQRACSFLYSHIHSHIQNSMGIINDAVKIKMWRTLYWALLMCLKDHRLSRIWSVSGHAYALIAIMATFFLSYSFTIIIRFCCPLNLATSH